MLFVLLSTYNGAAYIEEQLKSLASQSFQDFKVLIRDDGSTDSTRSLVENFAALDPRFYFLKEDTRHLGVVQSFSALLEKAFNEGASYSAFCDQDDLWLSEKLEKSLALLKEAEEKEGALPLAVHSDLRVCDQNLKEISASMKAADAALLKELGFFQLLAQNHVTGCTLLINRALMEAALPIPHQALMHDWWIALIAASLGKIYFLTESTVLYRQHGSNASGSARRLSLGAGLKKFLKEKTKMQELMRSRFEQSWALEERLMQKGQSPTLSKLKSFHSAVAQGRRSALQSAWKSGIKMSDPARSVAYYWMLFREAKKLRRLPA